MRGDLQELVRAARELVALKRTKERIENDLATVEEQKFYAQHKEEAWRKLEAALVGGDHYLLPSTLTVQEGGDHYKGRTIQPVEYWAANNLDAFQGAVVKYVTRHKEKGGLLDLKKSIHYTQIYIEQLHGVRSRIEYDNGKHSTMYVGKGGDGGDWTQTGGGGRAEGKGGGNGG